MPDLDLPRITNEPLAHAPVLSPGYAPRFREIQYHVILFSPDANGGPGVPLCELTPEVLNLRWQVAQNLPGMLTFTVVSPNAKLALIEPMRTHIKVYREVESIGPSLIFSGKLAKIVPKASDAVLVAWDYKALLQLSRTGYMTLYPSKKIGTEIVSPEWDLAKNVDRSPLAFVTTGTIENPLGTDGVTEITVSEDFGVVLFNRLFTFYQLAEMAMANTANNVVFDISRTSPHTFSFKKNVGNTIDTIDFCWPGNVIDFDYDDGSDMVRNDRATVITGTNGEEEYAVTDSASIDDYRRLQDAVSPATLIGESTGTTETDQTKAIMARLLQEGIRKPKSMVLQVRQGAFLPFAEVGLGDKIRVSVLGDDGTTPRFHGYARVTALAAAWMAQGGELIQIQGRGVDA